MTTLIRALIDASGLSRRKAFAAIREGRVRLDGAVATEPSGPYTVGALALDGLRLDQRARAHVYLLLNKPPGFVTTRSDERGRATVFDLVPADLRVIGLHPVGRLDLNTSGLLILTNDGDLTYRLSHPKHEIEKEYWVGLIRPPTLGQLAALRRGVELDGRVLRPLALDLLSGVAGFDVSLSIGEGRKRQVRRMFEAVGAKVRRLRRVREGPLRLATLPEGAVRELMTTEVTALFGD